MGSSFLASGDFIEELDTVEAYSSLGITRVKYNTEKTLNSGKQIDYTIYETFLKVV